MNKIELKRKSWVYLLKKKSLRERDKLGKLIAVAGFTTAALTSPWHNTRLPIPVDQTR